MEKLLMRLVLYNDVNSKPKYDYQNVASKRCLNREIIHDGCVKLRFVIGIVMQQFKIHWIQTKCSQRIKPLH